MAVFNKYHMDDSLRDELEELHTTESRCIDASESGVRAARQKLVWSEENYNRILERQEQTIDSLVESLHSHDLTKQEVTLLEERLQEMSGTIPPGGSVMDGNGDVGTEVLRSFTGHETAVRAVAVSEGCLYTASEDCVVHKWDLTTGKILLSFTGHRDWVTCLCIAEGAVFSGSADTTARLWDASDGSCETVFVGHTDAVWGCAVHQEHLFTASSDNTVRHWEMDTGVSLKVLRGHSDCVWTLVLDEHGRLFSGSDDCTIRVWDIESGETDRILTGHKAGVLSLCCENDRLISGSGDGTVRVWNPTGDFAFEAYTGHSGPVTTVCARGGCVFSGSVDMTIHMWSIQDYRLVHQYHGHTQEVTSVCICSGNLFAGSDSGVVVQYFTDGNERHTICGDLVGELMGIDHATREALEKMESDRAMALEELRAMKDQLEALGDSTSFDKERVRLLQQNKLERVLNRMMDSEPLRKSILAWRLNSAHRPILQNHAEALHAHMAEAHGAAPMSLDELRAFMKDPYHGFESMEALQQALVAEDKKNREMQTAGMRQVAMAVHSASLAL